MTQANIDESRVDDSNLGESSADDSSMGESNVVRSAWHVSLVLFCVFFPFTIAYSHIALGSALFFWVIDWIQAGKKEVSAYERMIYQIMALFIALNLLSGLVNGTFFASANLLKEHWLFLAIPVVADGLCDKRWRPIIIGAILLSVSVAGSYGIWQHYSGYSIRNHLLLYPAPGGDGFRAWGNFNQTLTYGNVMGIASAFAIGLSLGRMPLFWRIAAILTAILSAAGAALSYSRGPLLGIFVAGIVAIVIGVRESRKSVTPIIALILVVGYFAAPGLTIRFKEALPEISGQKLTGRAKSVSRTTIWTMGWLMVKDNPVFGVGPGNFYEEYNRRAGDSLEVTYRHAHNEILNIAAFAGVPATITYLAFWAVAFMMFLKALKKCKTQNLSEDNLADFWAHPVLLGALICSLAFMICSLTEATFADEEVRTALMLFWGIGFWAARSTGLTTDTAIH